jgi:hypothetical protein
MTGVCRICHTAFVPGSTGTMHVCLSHWGDYMSRWVWAPERVTRRNEIRRRAA